jgi:PAS domain S-box-containing protein
MMGGFALLATLVLAGLGAYLIREIRWRTVRGIELSEEHAKLEIVNQNLASDVVRLAELEQQLRESESRFRDIAEIGGDWIWETGTDHRFTLFTGSRERVTPIGETLESLIGKTRWEVAGGDPNGDANWRRYKADIDAHRKFRQFRYSIPTSSGSRLFVSVNGAPIFDASGVFRGYRGTATDETETIEALHRAERAEAMVRNAVDSISEAFVIYDADDRLVMCNDAYRRLYWDSAEILEPGLQFPEFLRHGLAQGRYVNAIGREEEWLAARIERHHNPSGSIEAAFSGGRWVLVSERRMRDGGYAGLRVDITKLKETELQLRETLERLDRIQRIAGIGSTTEDLTTGEYTWSPGACAIFGVDSYDTKPTAEYMRGFYHPDDRAKVAKAGEHARLLGVPSPPLEYRIIRPDGAVRTVYRENDIQVDAEGRPIRRIVTFKDITAIKETEARLRQTQEDLNRAQRLAKVGTDVWDLQTGHIEWSEEAYRIFGVDRGMFIPTLENFVNFVVPEDRASLVARRQEIMQGRCPAPAEFSIRRPDGEARCIYSEAELVRDATGKPIRCVGMHQDITEQRRIERSLRTVKEAAEVANLAKSHFLANMSHELRTPLNAILGFSEIIKDEVFGRNSVARYTEYASDIHASGQHLLDIINDILDLARVDAGKFELHEEAGLEIRHLIDACVSLMRDRASAGALHLSTKIEDHLPLLVADSTRLKQIMLNLMSNAIKFTEPGGSVVVAAWQPREGGIAFEVCDTGPGMTPDEIDISLEPFGQLDSKLPHMHEGTGLGLPLARRMAELHGGSFHVSSEKGRGTTVTVTLPASRIEAGRSTADAIAIPG